MNAVLKETSKRLHEKQCRVGRDEISIIFEAQQKEIEEIKKHSMKKMKQMTKEMIACMEKRQREVERLQAEGLTEEVSHLRAEIAQSKSAHEADIKHMKDQDTKYENQWKTWQVVALGALGAAVGAAAGVALVPAGVAAGVAAGGAAVVEVGGAALVEVGGAAMVEAVGAVLIEAVGTIGADGAFSVLLLLI